MARMDVELLDELHTYLLPFGDAGATLSQWCRMQDAASTSHTAMQALTNVMRQVTAGTSLGLFFCV